MSKTLTPEDLKAIGKEVKQAFKQCLKNFNTINPINSDELLTVDEVAAKLKISKQTVYKLLKENNINSLKIGKNLYIKTTDFNNYIQNKSL